MNGLELQRREAAELLASAEYFTCEKLHCRMKKQACADRQARGIGQLSGRNRVLPIPCIDCAQGAEIVREVRDTKDAKETRTGRTKPMTTETTTTTATRPEPTIVCVACEERKPLDEFHRDKFGKYGRKSTCKACTSARAKEYWRRKRDGQGRTRIPKPATTIPTGKIVPPEIPPDKAAATVRLFGPSTLILQFDGHDELKQWLEGEAKASFREPDQQALYILFRASREGAA